MKNEKVIAVVEVLSRHTRKTPAEGERLSRYQQKGDGTIAILSVLSGDVPKKSKKKDMAINYGEVYQRYRHHAKGTKMQIEGTIRELTKTQDIFYVSQVKTLSAAGAAAMIQDIRQDPQQKRTELIQADKGFSLEDADNLGAIFENQDIMAVHEVLCDIGYDFDLEVAYLVNTFFRRRARNRKFEDVSDMISANPMALTELAYQEPKFSPNILMSKIVNKPLDARIYAEVVSALHQLTQGGDSCVPMNKLYGYVYKTLSENVEDPSNYYDVFAKTLIQRDDESKLKAYAAINPFCPKNRFPDMRRKICEYFTVKFSEEIIDDPEKVKKNVDRLFGKTSIYLAKSFFSERRAAKSFIHQIRPDVIEECLADVAQLNETSTLDDEQIRCVENAITQRVSTIIGGAGTGKTRIVSEIVKILHEHGHNTLILAPSAKAALHAASEAEKNVGDSTLHLEYQTIHRCAKIMPEDEDNGVDGDFLGNNLDNSNFGKYKMLIVDEMSMCTIPVFDKVMRILDAFPGIHFVMVGDDQQLPAIGQQFFYQICDGLIEQLPLVKLEHNHRAKTDELATFAQNVRAGEFILPERQRHINMVDQTPEEFVNSHKALVKKDDTMVLVNSLKDADRLNNIIRKIRLGSKMQKIDGVEFYVKDILITTRNDYADSDTSNSIVLRHPDRLIDVFNGTDAILESYDEGAGSVQVRIFAPDQPSEGVLLDYYVKELPLYFKPAYAITVHKAQGSQAKTVVYYVDGNKRLSRNALYTAITRAEDKLYLLGEEDTLKEAVKKKSHFGITFFAFLAKQEYENMMDDDDDDD